MIKAITITLLVLLSVGSAFAGGSVVQTNTTLRTMNEYDLYWRITTNSWVSATIKGISGEIMRFVIKAQSTTNTYDATLEDADGNDLLVGQGQSASNTLIHRYADNGSTNMPIATDGDLTLIITNLAEDVSVSTSGVIKVYAR